MQIGDIHEEKLLISEELIHKFGEFSGDFNPIHFSDEAAREQGLKGRIAHGMLASSIFSKIFAQSFPGPGTIYLGQTLKFLAPVYVGETLHYRLEVIAQKDHKPIFTVKTECFGLDEFGDEILRISGEAVIRAKIPKLNI